jgi:hypothetical protein
LPLAQKAVIKKYSVVAIGKVICCHISSSTTLVVDELGLLLDNTDVINSPSLYVGVPNEGLHVPTHATIERVDASATCCKFIERNEEFLNNLSSEGTVENVEEYVACEHCNNKPCDWTEYGPSIIQHIANEYAGKANKQLRFLAYVAYTSTKHGYLGKRKRILIPQCVECGIRCIYPDENHSYVGFKEATIHLVRSRQYTLLEVLKNVN